MPKKPKKPKKDEEMADYELYCIRQAYLSKVVGDIIDAQPAGFDWGAITKRFVVLTVSGVTPEIAQQLKHPQFEDGRDNFDIPRSTPVLTERRVPVSKRLYRVPIDDPAFQAFFPEIDWEKLLSGEHLDPFRDGTYNISPDITDVPRIYNKGTGTLKKF